MNNVIYAYRKKSNQKIVYVGQSTNIKIRHNQHIYYDPFNINSKEYEYPLSRGVRKYGADEYELIILEENILKENLNDREKYWIKFYDIYFNGYNQTIGGSYPTKPKFNEDIIDTIIEMLKDESFSFQDISNKTGVSLTHIYNINMGNRRKRDEINYPIRPNNAKGSKGLKFSQEECVKIHEAILENKKQFKDIAKEFECDMATIRRINKGETKAYKLENYNYPLRKNAKSISKKLDWKNK